MPVWADGFNPGLRVEVVVSDGYITSIVVTDHNEEGYRYWGRPVNQIPKDIINAQSTEVDVVSGASYTSRGIIRAVENALSKAE